MDKAARNVGTLERVARIVGGGLAAGAGVTLLASGISSPWLAALEVAGVLLGLDFVFTGLTGHCPLYRWLGWSTARPPERQWPRS